MSVNIDSVVATLAAMDESSVGGYINELADLYRDGEDLRSLMPLLEHADPKFVSVAAWIISEVVNGSRGREVFAELGRLLAHPDPSVRFAVIPSVSLLIQPGEKAVAQKLLALAADSNAGVRQQALYYLCLLPDRMVSTLSGTQIWPSAHLMIAPVTREEIRFALGSTELLSQRLALAGALRNYGNDEDFIAEITSGVDDEIRNCLSTLPRNKAVVVR